MKQPWTKPFVLGLALAAALWAAPARASAPPEVIKPSDEPVANPTATPVHPSVKPDVDKGELLGHIQYLASPELHGREAGTPDQLKAADYVASEFKRYGLAPFGDEKDGARTFFQEFNLPESTGLGKDNELVMKAGDKETKLDLNKQFAPFPNGKAHGEAAGGVVFAGYGIEAPEYQYDDFQGVNLEGKWALIMRYEPQEQDPASKFAGRQFTQHAGLPAKLAACAKRKAIGVVMVTGPAAHAHETERLTDGRGPADENAPIPFIQITREVANALLEPSKKTIADLQGAIDKDLSCQSFELKDVTLSGKVDLVLEPHPTRNILAWIEGRDEKLKKEFVLIGAHCDHVGLGKAGSRLGQKGVGKMHPGADDNASGTAGLLEIAQYMAGLKPEERPRRSVILMAFSGEEKGLLGSEYYVKKPKAPLKDTVAMLNLDMIGRSADNGLQVSGIGTGKGFKDLVTAAAADTKLRIFLGTAGDGPSDHATFYHAGIPILFFFTGIHDDYHTPTDTWDKINAPVAEATAALAGKLLRKLADQDERPEFVKNDKRPYLGVGADMVRARNAQGFPVGSVAAGSPAAAAGVKVGDLITHLNGQKLSQPMDLNMAMIDFGVGDPLELTVKRGDEKLTIKLNLGERK